MNIHSLEKDKARLTALLDDERRERLDAFRKEEDALRSLAGGLLMRHIAGGKMIRYTEKGKPFVEGGPFFSMAHSGDYAAAVVSPRAQVGIDIENTEDMRGGNFSSLAKKAFHPDELRYFNEKPELRRFYEIWTQKEAFAKMKGERLGIGLKTFSVFSFSVPPFSQQYEVGREQPAAYMRLFQNLDPYIVAVCAAESVAVESFEKIEAVARGIVLGKHANTPPVSPAAAPGRYCAGSWRGAGPDLCR
jgi:4'-phosphopantetheinyl transferase